MYYLTYVSQDMTKGQITPKLIEDIVSVAAYKGAVLLITKKHRNLAHACTMKKGRYMYSIQHEVDTAEL